MANLKFDKLPKCDLTTWTFPDLEDDNEILHPDFVTNMLGKISGVIDAEVRKDTKVWLTDYGEFADYGGDGSFDPRLSVTLPLGEDDTNELDGQVSLLELVDQCISMNGRDTAALTAWGDHFKQLADLFYAAAQKGKEEET